MEKFISILIDTNDVVMFDSQLLSINEEYILRAMVENNFILLVYDDYCYLRKRLVEYYSKKYHVPCMSKMNYQQYHTWIVNQILTH